ncbi:hypothetical protein BDY19DRAFT_995900 [Irpex rosettiformis]|uniref:Uncharacterized protein n=1 Tax=Irpex rosettiformis TaxID=378272 RepID=A0ACB8TWV2_9APHY|nr:hypothetical protein BDY19DRAFT_995900 [Irpex rosettiformis]
MDIAYDGQWLRKIPNVPQEQHVRRQFAFHVHEPLTFRAPNGGPYRLASAYNLAPTQMTLMDVLHDYNKPVLQGTGTKYTIVVHIKGQERFAKQKYSSLSSGPRTLGGVARQIAEVVEEYIDKMQFNGPSDGDMWRLGPDNIKFEDLYLLELHQVSKASFQVTLGHHVQV